MLSLSKPPPNPAPPEVALASGPAPEVTPDAGNAAMQEQLRAQVGAHDDKHAKGTEVAPPTGTSADALRRAHPNGLTVSLTVDHTFLDAAEQARTAELPADRRASAARYLDATGWSTLYRSRWAPAHVSEMDRLSEGAYSRSAVGSDTRAGVLTTVWRAHNAEIKRAMVADDATWSRLVNYTESQDDHFSNEAEAFATRHAAVKVEGGQLQLGKVIPFSGPADITARVQDVHRTAVGLLGDTEAARIRNVGIFTHGTQNGLMGRNAPSGRATTDGAALVRGIDDALTADVHIGLYACDTAKGGEGSFADELRDALRAEGHPDAIVLGHTSVQDTVANNDVSLFGADDDQTVDGQYRDVFPRSVRDEIKAAVERATGLRITSQTNLNVVMIYFYNRECLWSLDTADLADRASLQAQARTWALGFVADPAWRDPLVAQLRHRHAVAD